MLKTEAQKFLSASMLMVCTRLSERVLGLVSTLILARLLVPEDFGIVAMAMIFITFITILASTGLQQYIVRKSIVSEADLNTAWTLNFALKMSLVPIVLIASPYIAEFYGDYRISSVLNVVILIAPLEALKNPALYLEVKEQKYRKLATIALTRKLFSVLGTVAFALIYTSYWSLIFGHIISNLTAMIMSYILIRKIPKFTFEKLSEQWNFSKWFLFKEVFSFIRSQLDAILVGRLYSPAVLGGYHVSKYLSFMPTSQLLEPAMAPLLASFSKVKDDHEDLIYQVRLVLSVAVLTVIPLSIFIFFYSEPIVGVILGPNWLEFSNIFGLLALVGISIEYSRVAITLITAKSKVKYLFYYDVTGLFIVALVLFYMANFDIYYFVIAKVFTDSLLSISLFLTVGYYLKNSKTFLFFVAAGFLHALICYFICRLISPLFSFFSVSFVGILFVGLLYILVLFFLHSILYIFCYNKRKEARHIKQIVMNVFP